MKTSLSLLSLLSVLLSSAAMAETTLIDFGGTQNKFEAPWNQSAGAPSGRDLTTTGTIFNTTGVSSSISATYKAGTILVIGNPTPAHLTNVTVDAFGSYGQAMWQQAHGVALTTANISSGWTENSLLTIGSLVDPGTINVGGFKAQTSYTVSAVFTVSGLVGIDTGLITKAPINLQGSNFSLNHAYLTGCNGQILDVKAGGIELAALLNQGTFMMTWQLQTNSSFVTSSTINMAFDSALLGLGGGYGISAMAVTDSAPDLTIPEPSVVLLGVFGFAGLMLKRRRK